MLFKLVGRLTTSPTDRPIDLSTPRWEGEPQFTVRSSTLSLFASAPPAGHRGAEGGEGRMSEKKRYRIGEAVVNLSSMKLELAEKVVAHAEISQR